MLTDDAIGRRISELLDTINELEDCQDYRRLGEDEVHELADSRVTIANYAIAQTVERFDLDIE